MTQEEQTLLIIKGSISEMPDAERERIMECYRDLKAKLEQDPVLGMAIALLGAELAAQ